MSKRSKSRRFNNNYIDYLFNREQYKVLKSQAEEMNMEVEEYFDCILNMYQNRDSILYEESRLRNLTNNFNEIPENEDLQTLVLSIRNLIYYMNEERSYLNLLIEASQSNSQ